MFVREGLVTNAQRAEMLNVNVKHDESLDWITSETRPEIAKSSRD